MCNRTIAKYERTQETRKKVHQNLQKKPTWIRYFIYIHVSFRMLAIVCACALCVCVCAVCRDETKKKINNYFVFIHMCTVQPKSETKQLAETEESKKKTHMNDDTTDCCFFRKKKTEKKEPLGFTWNLYY